VARLRAVFFDVGVTLVDETREYGAWAEWLGVPPHTFSAGFGAMIARGGDDRETFQRFRPGFDLWAERERRAELGQPETFGESDLYPEGLECLAAIRDQGILVGVAGNQTLRAGRSGVARAAGGRGGYLPGMGCGQAGPGVLRARGGRSRRPRRAGPLRG
jgi:beta-phosphoglucomutase-like phosphatase (HAD superfamily)